MPPAVWVGIEMWVEGSFKASDVLLIRAGRRTGLCLQLGTPRETLILRCVIEKTVPLDCREHGSSLE